jgi:hypothetical protein
MIILLINKHRDPSRGAAAQGSGMSFGKTQRTAAPGGQRDDADPSAMCPEDRKIVLAVCDNDGK